MLLQWRSSGFPEAFCHPSALYINAASAHTRLKRAFVVIQCIRGHKDEFEKPASSAGVRSLAGDSATVVLNEDKTYMADRHFNKVSLLGYARAERESNPRTIFHALTSCCFVKHLKSASNFQDAHSYSGRKHSR